MEKAYEEQQTGFIIASKDRFKSTLDRWTVHNPIRSPDIIFFMCVFCVVWWRPSHAEFRKQAWMKLK